MFLDQCLLLSWYEIITFRSISREVAEKMNCDQKTIVNHLHSMRFAKKLGVWVPHELSENNKKNCLQIASQHLARHRATRNHKQSFLYRIVTGDEKCYLYKYEAGKEWVSPEDTPKPRVKPDLHPRKTMSLRMVGLGGYGALGNARNKCHGQQEALHNPATSRE